MRLDENVNGIPINYSLRMAVFSWSEKSQEPSLVLKCLELIREACDIFDNGYIDLISLGAKGKYSKRKYGDKNWELMESRLANEELSSISFYNKKMILEPPRYEVAAFINELSEKYYFHNNHIYITIPIVADLEKLREYKLLFEQLVKVFDADYGFANVYMESTDVRAEALAFSKLIDIYPIDCLNHSSHEGEVKQIKDINWLNFLSKLHLSQIEEIPKDLCCDYKYIKDGLYFSVSEKPQFDNEGDKERINKLREITKDIITEDNWWKRYESRFPKK